MNYLFIPIFFISFLLTGLNAASDDYTLNVDSPTLSEAAGTTAVNIRVTPQNKNTYISGDQINLHYQTENSGGTADATAGSDYTSASGNLIITVDIDGTALIQIPITILQDTAHEGDEEFALVITSASVNNGQTVDVGDGGLITITDDDTASHPTLSIGDRTIAEGDVDVSLTVSLSATSSDPVTFSYSTLDVTATSGNDYTETGTTSTIPAGSLSVNITIPILGDIVNEGDETFAVYLSNISNATGGDIEGIVTITDDDIAPTISINDAAIAEGDIDKDATVKIILSSPNTSELTVLYHTLAGSATADVDYTQITSGSITIPTGSSEANLTLNIKGDDLSEGIEEFYLIIDSVTGTDAPLLADDNSTITIFDDDSSGSCSSYVGLITLNEYQNNPHYFEGPRSDPDSKITGNYVEIKYIDFLVKRFVTDDWEVSVLGSSGTQSIEWRDRDQECVDPRYEIFQFDNNVMGARGYVTLKDQNGNEVDVLAIHEDAPDYYTQQCQDFVYDTDFDSSAQNKDIFREPDGTGDWVDQGSGANSGGSRCINKDSPAGLLFTEFDAIDTGVTPGIPIFNESDVPIMTKVANSYFDLDILSLETTDPSTIGELKNTSITIKVYLADENGDKLPGYNPAKEVIFTDANTVTVSNLIYMEARKIVRLAFEYCGTDTGADADWSTCYETGNTDDEIYQRRAHSRDAFAIRPSDFNLTMSDADAPNLLRAGQDYGISLTAIDGNTTTPEPTIGYTIIDHNFNGDLLISTIKYFNDTPPTEDTANILYGTAEINTSATAYSVNGLSSFNTTGPLTPGIADDSIRVYYDDVGLITLQIIDPIWAEIDNDDTPMDCTSASHTYICGDKNVTYIPHHFNVENIHLRNHKDGNYTYLSNDLNMSAHIDANISARNADEGITYNFRQGSLYYENPVSVDLNITEWLGAASRHLKGNSTHKHDIPTEMLLGFGGPDINGTHNIPWDESNATQQLMFNYTRENDQTVNPFTVNGTDINVTVQSTYTDGSTPSSPAVIEGSDIADRNATFYFGRTKSSKFFYDNILASSVNTPISVVVYCDVFPTCTELTDNIQISGKINEPHWWLSLEHVETTGDGNITLQTGTITPSGSASITPDSDVTVLVQATDNDVNVQKDSGPLRMTVEIELDTTPNTDTNSWLIYNPDSPTLNPDPFYKVRFIGQGGWAGHGKTGHVVDSNASKEINKRLSW